MKQRFGIQIVLAALLAFSALTVVGCAHSRQRTHQDIMEYGVRLAKQGYWHEAAYQWRRVLDEDPDNVAALNNLAVAAEVEGYPEKAQTALYQALQLRSDSTEIQRNYKSVERRLSGDPQEEEPVNENKKND